MSYNDENGGGSRSGGGDAISNAKNRTRLQLMAHSKSGSHRFMSPRLSRAKRNMDAHFSLFKDMLTPTERIKSGDNSLRSTNFSHVVPLLRHTPANLNDLAETLMSDPLLLQEFRSHLEVEFADENLEFFEMATKYKQHLSIELANSIINTYIAPHSLRQVSQPYECKDDIEKAAQTMNATNEPNESIFDEAMMWCMTYMREAWPRFLKSKFYGDYLSRLAADDPELLNQLDLPSDILPPDRKLMWLLKNPLSSVARQFSVYLKKTFASELMDVWREIDFMLHEVQSAKETMKHATHIFNTFIKSGAPQEVNLDESLRNTVQQDLNRYILACTVTEPAQPVKEFIGQGFIAVQSKAFSMLLNNLFSNFEEEYEPFKAKARTPRSSYANEPPGSLLQQQKKSNNVDPKCTKNRKTDTDLLLRCSPKAILTQHSMRAAAFNSQAASLNNHEHTTPYYDYGMSENVPAAKSSKYEDNTDLFKQKAPVSSAENRNISVKWNVNDTVPCNPVSLYSNVASDDDGTRARSLEMLSHAISVPTQSPHSVGNQPHSSQSLTIMTKDIASTALLPDNSMHVGEGISTVDEELERQWKIIEGLTYENNYLRSLVNDLRIEIAKMSLSERRHTIADINVSADKNVSALEDSSFPDRTSNTGFHKYGPVRRVESYTDATFDPMSQFGTTRGDGSLTPTPRSTASASRSPGGSDAARESHKLKKSSIKQLAVRLLHRSSSTNSISDTEYKATNENAHVPCKSDKYDTSANDRIPRQRQSLQVFRGVDDGASGYLNCESSHSGSISAPPSARTAHSHPTNTMENVMGTSNVGGRECFEADCNFWGGMGVDKSSQERKQVLLTLGLDNLTHFSPRKLSGGDKVIGKGNRRMSMFSDLSISTNNPKLPSERHCSTNEDPRIRRYSTTGMMKEKYVNHYAPSTLNSNAQPSVNATTCAVTDYTSFDSPHSNTIIGLHGTKGDALSSNDQVSTDGSLRAFHMDERASISRSEKLNSSSIKHYADLVNVEDMSDGMHRELRRSMSLPVVNLGLTKCLRCNSDGTPGTKEYEDMQNSTTSYMSAPSAFNTQRSGIGESESADKCEGEENGVVVGGASAKNGSVVNTSVKMLQEARLGCWDRSGESPLRSPARNRSASLRESMRMKLASNTAPRSSHSGTSELREDETCVHLRDWGDVEPKKEHKAEHLFGVTGALSITDENERDNGNAYSGSKDEQTQAPFSSQTHSQPQLNGSEEKEQTKTCRNSSLAPTCKRNTLVLHSNTCKFHCNDAILTSSFDSYFIYHTPGLSPVTKRGEHVADVANTLGESKNIDVHRKSVNGAESVCICKNGRVSDSQRDSTSERDPTSISPTFRFLEGTTHTSGSGKLALFEHIHAGKISRSQSQKCAITRPIVVPAQRAELKRNRNCKADNRYGHKTSWHEKEEDKHKAKALRSNFRHGDEGKHSRIRALTGTLSWGSRVRSAEMRKDKQRRNSFTAMRSSWGGKKKKKKYAASEINEGSLSALELPLDCLRQNRSFDSVDVLLGDALTCSSNGRCR